MLKALIVLVVAGASLAPAVDATPAGAETKQLSQIDEKLMTLDLKSSLREKRQSDSGGFVFPTKEIEDFITSIRGQHSSDTIVFPGPSGKPFVPSEEFGYGSKDGPHTWSKTFPFCGLKRQSPINIDLGLAKRPPSSADAVLSFRHYDAPPSLLTVTNSGHSLRMTGNWTSGRSPSISGLALHGDYSFSEVHFHWGANNQEGSEHLVQGQRFPLEMHVVHYKTEYGSFKEALKKRDGLVVLSYLFKIQEHTNPALQKVIIASKELADPHSPAVTIDTFTLDKLVQPFRSNYAVYVGSLTTPPCTEIVTWIVNLEPQFVSSEQLEKFRGLRRSDGSRMLFNFRPIQSLYGRGIMHVP